jgi:hypothetical protein
MLRFIPVVIVPRILFVSIFNLRSGPVLRDPMIRGKSHLDVLPNLAAVWSFTFIFIVLAMADLSKFRRGWG